MADWYNITDAQVDPDAPLTSELAYAWKDNVIAAFEGAPGSPRLWVRALKGPSAGSVTKIIQTNTVTQASSFSISMMSWGEVRLSVDGRRTSGAGGAVSFVRVRDRSTTVISNYSLTTSFTTYSADVSFRPHDTLRIAVTAADGGQETRNYTVATSGDDIWYDDLSTSGTSGGTVLQTFWNSL